LEEILPGIQELQEMCADMPGTIGPACATGDYTDVLMLEESNLDSLLDKIDAILSTNESTYQKLNSIMDKCGNLCDFSVARQLNDDAYEQQNRLKDLKDLIIRYAFLIKQIDSELSIRYQGMIARISDYTVSPRNEGASKSAIDLIRNSLLMKGWNGTIADTVIDELVQTNPDAISKLGSFGRGTPYSKYKEDLEYLLSECDRLRKHVNFSRIFATIPDVNKKNADITSVNAPDAADTSMTGSTTESTTER